MTQISLTRPGAARRRLLGASALATLLLAAGCSQSFNSTDITGVRYAQDFRLQGADGQERTMKDFRGKAVLIFFGFTQCPDVCPTELLKAAEVKRLLGPQGDRLQVVFITVDPERDTPEVLREYTRAFDPDFVGLYGTPQRTADTARDFRVHFKKVPTQDSYTMEHSSFSYLFDAEGQPRLVAGYALTAEQIADDVRKLLS